MRAIKTKEDLKAFWDAFYNCYGEGIYIKSDAHPCGWDWIDLTNYNSFEEMMKEPLSFGEISCGNYAYHHSQGYTPFGVLQEVEENWCFDRSDIDWV